MFPLSAFKYLVSMCLLAVAGSYIYLASIELTLLQSYSGPNIIYPGVGLEPMNVSYATFVTVHHAYHLHRVMVKAVQASVTKSPGLHDNDHLDSLFALPSEVNSFAGRSHHNTMHKMLGETSTLASSLLDLIDICVMSANEATNNHLRPVYDQIMNSHQQGSELPLTVNDIINSLPSAVEMSKLIAAVSDSMLISLRLLKLLSTAVSDLERFLHEGPHQLFWTPWARSRAHSAATLASGKHAISILREHANAINIIIGNLEHLAVYIQWYFKIMPFALNSFAMDLPLASMSKSKVEELQKTILLLMDEVEAASNAPIHTIQPSSIDTDTVVPMFMSNTSLDAERPLIRGYYM